MFFSPSLRRVIETLRRSSRDFLSQLDIRDIPVAQAGDPSAGTDRVLVTYEKSLVMEDLPPEEVRARQVTLRADGLPNLDPLRKAAAGYCVCVCIYI